MRHDKDTALKMRLSEKSYSQISRTLGVPKSTLSNWFSNLVLSPEALNRIQQRSAKKSREGLLKRNKNKTRLARKRAATTRRETAKQSGYTMR